MKINSGKATKLFGRTLSKKQAKELIEWAEKEIAEWEEFKDEVKKRIK